MRRFVDRCRGVVATALRVGGIGPVVVPFDPVVGLVCVGLVCLVGLGCAPLALPAGARVACAVDDDCGADVCVAGLCRDAADPCVDGGAPVDDGAACGDGVICVAGACVDAVCGDGFTSAGEDCDDGDDNSDVAKDACRADCAAAACGDGVVDTGESCEGGADCDAACVLVCAAGSADCDADGENGCECAPARLLATDFRVDEVCFVARAGVGGDVIAVVGAARRLGDPVPWRLLRISGAGVFAELTAGESVSCPLLAADDDAAYVVLDDHAGLVVDLDGRDPIGAFSHPCVRAADCAASLGDAALFVAQLFPGDEVVAVDRASRGAGAGAPFFTTDIAGLAATRGGVVVALRSGAVAVLADDGAVAPVGSGFGGVPGVAAAGDDIFVFEDQRLWRADRATLVPVLVDTLPPAAPGAGAQLVGAHPGQALLRVVVDGDRAALTTWDAPRGRAMVSFAGFPKSVVADDGGLVIADPDGVVVVAR